MERIIAHCDLDTFFVSVERLHDPELLGLPVLVGGTSDRGVVASCSYEARKFGIHSAMSMKRARQLCPEAIVVRGNHDEYAKWSKIVTEIICSEAPVVEKASIDEHYLDLSGMNTLVDVRTWVSALRARIMRETGLPISFGTSSSKTVAKIATGMAKPCGEFFVTPGEERAFLAPLPVKKIPGAGNTTCARLAHLGIDTIGKLQQVSPEALMRSFGKSGFGLWQKANGLCDAPVAPFSERKSLSKETTFGTDITDEQQLRRHLSRLVDKLGFLLRSENKLTACITIKIRYSDFETVSKQMHIAPNCSQMRLNEKAAELFSALYPKGRALRLVGVRFSELMSGSYQIDLFNDAETDLNLSKAMDNIRLRFGEEKIQRAAAICA